MAQNGSSCLGYIGGSQRSFPMTVPPVVDRVNLQDYINDYFISHESFDDLLCSFYTNPKANIVSGDKGVEELKFARVEFLYLKQNYSGGFD